jgi:hypothetical protein
VFQPTGFEATLARIAAMLCGSGRARSALDLRCALVIAESKAFRRARLVPNEAPRGAAAGTDFATVATCVPLSGTRRFETRGSEHAQPVKARRFPIAAALGMGRAESG